MSGGSIGVTTGADAGFSLDRLRLNLDSFDPDAEARLWLEALLQQGLDQLPLPGHGATLQRWQALAAVAQHDLSLAKLYEGHTDAIAIFAELGAPEAVAPGQTWGVWAAEAPGGRTRIEPAAHGRVSLHGVKLWCSGAASLSHGLLTAWHPDGRGPQLVRVAMAQPEVSVSAQAWRAVGMAGSASIDVTFRGALADLVGGVGDYLSRPGFWHGGAGVATCWYGGALALGTALRRSVTQSPVSARTGFRLAALGRVELALHSTAALLRQAAHWIDAQPRDDASQVALRVRLAAEATAKRVLDEAGRALGAAAFCRDARFARTAADLPVFVRQSHAERDLAALGERVVASSADEWAL